MTADPGGWRESLAPLRSRAFRLQFAARSTSMTGSMLSPVALSLGALKSGLSVGALGMVLAAYTVPLVALVLVGGVAADRLPRHRIMIVTDSIRAVSQTGVGVLLLSGHPAVLPLVLLQGLTGAATAFYQPASSGLTPQTTERAHLQQANALLSLTRSLAGSVGPLLGALLVVTVGAGWALLIDGMTFAGSAILLSRIALPVVVSAPTSDARFLSQLREGFSETRSRSWVWSTILTFGVCNLTASALLVLGPEKLLHHPGAGALGWAGIVAAMSVGEVLGNLTALRTAPGRPMLVARLVGAAQAPLLVAVALGAPVPVLLAAGLACGIGMALADALWFTALQANLPDAALSRVSSYDWLGSLALRPIGLIGGAAAGTALGVPTTLTGAAVVVFLTCTLGSAQPGIHRIRALQPTEPTPTAAL